MILINNDDSYSHLLDIPTNIIKIVLPDTSLISITLDMRDMQYAFILYRIYSPIYNAPEPGEPEFVRIGAPPENEFLRATELGLAYLVIATNDNDKIWLWIPVFPNSVEALKEYLVYSL